jgi:SpoVK/Ycf46/Vps4 family AAA+-type ATPase
VRRAFLASRTTTGHMPEIHKAAVAHSETLAPEVQSDLILTYPDDAAAARYAALVGVEDVKARLHNELALRLAPERLREWADRHGQQGLVADLASPQARTPVIVLTGDSGTGKTALAESVGDPLSRSLGVKFYGYRIAPSAGGARQLEGALKPTRHAELASMQPNPETRGHIFIYDEHYLLGAVPPSHRGGPARAPVAEMLQTAEALAARGEPTVIVVCVSHPAQVDPAVRRLSLEPFQLHRPDAAQREIVLRRLTERLALTDAELVRLVLATGPSEEAPGYTYGDLVQRLMHTAVLASYPDRPLTAAAVVAAARRMSPTPTASGDDLESPQPPAD